MNNSTTGISLKSTTSPIFVVSIFIYVTIFIVGAVGNISVLIIFGRRILKPKTCEPHYIYLVSLALCDFLGSIIIPADKLYYLLGGCYVYIGVPGCISISFLTIMTFTVSSLTLMAISVHRFVMVKWPFRPHTTTKCTCFILAGIWMVGCLPGIPYFMKGHVGLHDIGTNRKVCAHNMTHKTHLIHTLATFVIQTAAPLVVIVTAYFFIIYELMQRERVLSDHGEESLRRHEQNKKTVKLLLVVVAMFFACVSPANIFYLFYLFNGISLSQKNTMVTFNILIMIQMFNNCINPIIYSKLHTSFRNNILKTIQFCFYHCFLRWKIVAYQQIANSKANNMKISWKNVWMKETRIVITADGDNEHRILTANGRDKFEFSRAEYYKKTIFV